MIFSLNALTRLTKSVSAIACTIVFAGCASIGGADKQVERPSVDKVKPSAGMVAVKPSGGYYDRDGPPEVAPADLARIPDAVPRKEALLAWSNRPYTVFGQRYTPMTLRTTYKQTGIASWYGKQFHGRKTSSGEVYDMLGMTAAHPTLPIPSFVRVTNIRNGIKVVVRVNDRGPFLQNRLIDLSFAAATKLDYVNSGHTPVEIELIRLDENGDVLDEPVQTASVKVVPTVPVAPVQPTVVAASASNVAVKTQPTGARGSAPTGTLPPSSHPPNTPPVLANVQPSLGLTQSVVSVSASSLPENAPREDSRAVALRTEQAVARVTNSSDVYLQLGAFSSAENAESAVLRVARSLPDIGSQISVAQDGSLHKIRAGPYDPIAAVKVADLVQATTGYRPFKIQAPK